MNKREPFNKSMDAELLKNDFAFYDDWEYGPISGWSSRFEHYSLKLMRHDFGYDLIISRHASGHNPFMNIGSSNNAAEIIELRDGLKRLF